MQAPRDAEGGGVAPRAVAGQRNRSQGARPGWAQAKSTGFQPLPAHSVQLGISKGRRDAWGQRTAACSGPSPARAGDGETAEGEGDGVGKGNPAGFEPLPAGVGDGGAAEGEVDGEGKDNPAGFKPSPADAENTTTEKSHSVDKNHTESMAAPDRGSSAGTAAGAESVARTWRRPAGQGSNWRAAWS